MTDRQLPSQMTKLALCVSMFVYFAFGVGRVEAGCGDYLQHAAKRVFSDHTANRGLSPSSDSGTDSQPVPLCRGGHCHSAPTSPPVEPTRVVLSFKQHLDFRVTFAEANGSRARAFGLSDDLLPSSASLEVLTPPPIAVI